MVCGVLWGMSCRLATARLRRCCSSCVMRQPIHSVPCPPQLKSLPYSLSPAIRLMGVLCVVRCVRAVCGVDVWPNAVMRKGFYRAHGQKRPHYFDCSSMYVFIDTVLFVGTYPCIYILLLQVCIVDVFVVCTSIPVLQRTVIIRRT